MLKIRFLLPFILSLISCFAVSAQQNGFVIDRTQTPLSTILDELRDSSQVQLSFNATQLSQYHISLTDSFETVDAALQKLLYGLPFVVEKVGLVYLISPFEALENQENTSSLTLLNGFVKDRSSGEFLPYCTVYVNDQLRITDVRGRFSFIAFTSEKLHINARFLGFELLDTTIIAQPEFSCEMVPKVMELSEAKITGVHNKYSLLAGEEVGVVRLNQHLASSVAGSVNNGIYNLLRLQSGVLANGEQSTGLSMWGSYQGQNQVLFDGMTVFSVTGNNPFINIINPIVVKDILINKGGMGAQYGDRVGGVVEITGIDGNYKKPEVKLILDNMMVNGLFTTSIKSRNALMISLRQTWFPTVTQSALRQASNKYADGFTHSVIPNNSFRDLHLKYTGNRPNGDQYYLSVYNSKAVSDFAISDFVQLNSAQNQRQSGVAAYYGTTWFNGVNSSFLVSYSDFRNNTSLDSTWHNASSNWANTINKNSINEVKASFDNRFSISSMQFVEVGLTSSLYSTSYNYAYQQVSFLERESQLLKFGGYIRNHISANKVLTMDIGLRVDYSPNPGEVYFQPRIKSSVKLAKNLFFNAGLGVYNQYISQVSVVDENGNYGYVWDVSNQDGRPALQTDMVSSGISYKNGGWLLNSEFFYKRTVGLTRYLTKQNSAINYGGNSKSYGVDLMVKKDYRKHATWVSFATGKTEEYMEYFSEVAYKPTVFNQSYEIKGATFFNFSPLYLSANYVYGSGLPQSDNLLIDFGAYQRIDMSITYKMDLSNSKLNMGVSVQNLLNRQNRSLASTTLLSSGISDKLAISTSEIPFFATLFVGLNF